MSLAKSILKKGAIEAGTAIINHYAKNHTNNQTFLSQSDNSRNSLLDSMTVAGNHMPVDPGQDRYSPGNLSRSAQTDQPERPLVDIAEQLGPLGVELVDHITQLDTELEQQKEQYGPDDERVKRTEKKIRAADEKYLELVLNKMDNDAKTFSDWLQRDLVVPTEPILNNIRVLESGLNGWITEYGFSDEAMEIQQELYRYQQLLQRAEASRIQSEIRLGRDMRPRFLGRQ